MIHCPTKLKGWTMAKKKTFQLPASTIGVAAAVLATLGISFGGAVGLGYACYQIDKNINPDGRIKDQYTKIVNKQKDEFERTIALLQKAGTISQDIDVESVWVEYQNSMVKQNTAQAEQSAPLGGGGALIGGFMGSVGGLICSDKYMGKIYDGAYSGAKKLNRVVARKREEKLIGEE